MASFALSSTTEKGDAPDDSSLAEKGERRSVNTAGSRRSLSDGLVRWLTWSSSNPSEATASPGRNAHIKRLRDVTLGDLLEHELAAPISLRDFELYLVHRTRSAENLYVECWYRRYKTLFAASHPRQCTPDEAAVLQEAYRLGLAFIESGNGLEVNVTDRARRELSDAAEELVQACAVNPDAVEPFLPPDAFRGIVAETRPLLQAAFRDFLYDRAGNAHSPRNIALRITGVVIFFLSFFPLILPIVLNAARGWRFLALPFAFWGVGQATAAARRTCLLIFLARGSRQLYRYEQVSQTSPDSPVLVDLPRRPSDTPSVPPTVPAPVHFHSSRQSHVSTFPDQTLSPEFLASPTCLVSSGGTPILRPAAFPSAMTSERFSDPPLAYFPPSRAASDPTVYFSPAHDQDLIRRLSLPAPVVGTQLAKQESPLVKQEQLRSIIWATIAGGAATAVMLLLVVTIPNRS
ncbi:hypothetical protein JCM6882_000940 [Rhodosporidiobolus microsporus]